jgi:hypothetical protein
MSTLRNDSETKWFPVDKRIMIGREMESNVAGRWISCRIGGGCRWDQGQHVVYILMSTGWTESNDFKALLIVNQRHSVLTVSCNDYIPSLQIKYIP